MIKKSLLKMSKAAVAFSLAFCMMITGCGSAGGNNPTGTGSAAPTEGATQAPEKPKYSTTVTEKDIEITISTDKDSYSAGEVVEYTITLTNNREYWQVNSFEFKYDEIDGMEVAEGTTAPAKFAIVKPGETVSLTGSLVGKEGAKFTAGKDNTGSKAAEYETVKIRPYHTFKYAGKDVTIRSVMELHVLQQKISLSGAELSAAKQTTCHDPSIFKDKDGTYYIFGTHMGLSKTEDLKNWTNMDATFRASFTKEVQSQIRAWNKDETAGQWFDYLWAPDVIWNPVMEKYCMYLSANGDNWKSNIVLLTADEATGPYEYAGSVVMGGFISGDYDQTDVEQATGEATMAKRYTDYGVRNGKWGHKYPNCIDPCVFYDDNGNLYMSYGSWSGGIFMLELDENTGLRDYSVKYEDNDHSDPYFGKKIAGGWYVSGEASYIQKIGNYYYLFVSYGALEAAGGYNIRIFRSKYPDRDYVDEKGNTPFYDSYVKNFNDNIGIRLFGGYKWRTFNYGQVAQGHNSAFVDDDGRAYIVFHTRTTNGSEGHYVKVHQLFQNKEGWLVAAPFQTDGEVLDYNKGIDMKTVAGQYEIILHELDIDYANLEAKKPKFANLNADGTITGAYEGSWELVDGKPYIYITVDGVCYSGVMLNMKVENSTIETTVFTALGDTNQVTIWGVKSFK